MSGKIEAGTPEETILNLGEPVVEPPPQSEKMRRLIDGATASESDGAKPSASGKLIQNWNWSGIRASFNSFRRTKAGRGLSSVAAGAISYEVFDWLKPVARILDAGSSAFTDMGNTVASYLPSAANATNATTNATDMVKGVVAQAPHIVQPTLADTALAFGACALTAGYVWNRERTHAFVKKYSPAVVAGFRKAAGVVSRVVSGTLKIGAGVANHIAPWAIMGGLGWYGYTHFGADIVGQVTAAKAQVQTSMMGGAAAFMYLAHKLGMKEGFVSRTLFGGAVDGKVVSPLPAIGTMAVSGLVGAAAVFGGWMHHDKSMHENHINGARATTEQLIREENSLHPDYRRLHTPDGMTVDKTNVRWMATAGNSTTENGTKTTIVKATIFDKDAVTGAGREETVFFTHTVPLKQGGKSQYSKDPTTYQNTTEENRKLEKKARDIRNGQADQGLKELGLKTNGNLLNDKSTNSGATRPQESSVKSSTGSSSTYPSPKG